MGLFIELSFVRHMRKYYWYTTAFIKKYWLLFVGTLIGGILLFSVLVPWLVNRLESQQATFVGLVGQYNLDRLPPAIAEQLSTGLTSLNPDGSVSPMVADRWTIEQEGTTYRFAIREGVRWQDGSEFSTSEIDYALPDVETIVTPRDIVFRLPAPFAPFPTVVSTPLFKPGELTRWGVLTKPTVIGLTSARIVDYTTRTASDTLEELIVEDGDQRWIYRFYLSEADAIDAFKRGEVDVVPNLAKIWPIMEWNNVVTTARLHSDQYSAIFFNHQDSRFTKNVRQALAYGITKPEPERRALGPIDAQSWAYLPGGKSYDKDVERAIERLLAEVPREPLRFSLTTTSLFETQAEQYKQEWQELGVLAVARCQESDDIEEKELCENLAIQVDLRITNFPDTSSFDTILIGMDVPPDPDQYQLWHSEQPTNFSRYKNTRIDNLLEKGRQTYEKAERVTHYQEFQQFLLEDVAAIFLEQLPSYDIKRK